MFTGDQSDLHAGEANAPLSEVLGERSVLVLDGPEHLRQRRLLLPPFQGGSLAAMRPVIREVAEAEVDRWQAGREFALRERMRALTFEVICRAVFGVHEPDRVERLRRAMLAVIDTQVLFLVPAALRRGQRPRTPGGWVAGRLRAADALLYEEIARRRARSRSRRADRRALAAAAGARRGRAADDRRRVARRADDDARRRPRDDLNRAGVRGRPAAAQSGRARPAAGRARRSRRRVPRCGRFRDPADPPRGRRGRAHPEGAAQGRRLGAAGRDPRVSGDRAGPPPRRPVPRARAVPARTLHSTRARSPTPGCRSGAGSGAASAPPSPRPRSPRYCG